MGSISYPKCPTYPKTKQISCLNKLFKLGISNNWAMSKTILAL